MKRKFKSIASLVLAAVMVFAMAVPGMSVSAAGDKTITITSAGTGHTFKAYQIFTGDVYDEDASDSHEGDGKDEVLSNIEWGNGLTDAGRTKLAEAVYGKEGVPSTYTAEDVAKQLATKTASELEGIFKAVAGEVQNGTASAPSGDNYTISGLATGYYLVIDTAPGTVEGEDTAFSSYIVEVVGDATVKTKAEIPSSEKKVLDVNDSVTNPDDAAYKDSADYDIGDAVPFQLTGTVAANYADYDKYYFAFHDTESNGLTFNPDSVKVYVDYDGDGENPREEITGKKDSFWTLAENVNHGGEPAITHTFDIVFNNLKDDPKIQAGSKIIIEYTSTLNTSAVIGEPGNPNDMYLEYSNNPQDEERGQTPTHRVVVFTFDVNVDKVGPDGNPLPGAEFELAKYDPDNDDADEEGWVSIDKMTIDSETQFTFRGVDDGIYRLKESKTPDGYNTINPDTIYINVQATHAGEDITNLTAKAYETWLAPDKFEDEIGSDGVVNFQTNGDKVLESTTGEQTKDSIENMTDSGKAGHIGAFGWLTTAIINNEGTTLPETGGIGTTIFYVVGSVLVLGAVILLVTKRRMKSE